MERKSKKVVKGAVNIGRLVDPGFWCNERKGGRQGKHSTAGWSTGAILLSSLTLSAINNEWHKHVV